MHWICFSAAALALAVAFGISGCGSSATTKSTTSTTAATERHQASHENGNNAIANHPESSAANADITAALAELPADDKTLAEKQKVCPVSGELLGTMGTPIKIDVKGQPVFICCEGCKEKLLSTPDEYLAKLKK